jgi:hypothetical protein
MDFKCQRVYVNVHWASAMLKLMPACTIIMAEYSAPVFLIRTGCLNKAIRPVDAQGGTLPAQTVVSQIAKEQWIMSVPVSERRVASLEEKLRTIANFIILTQWSFGSSSTIRRCCRMCLPPHPAERQPFFVYNAAPRTSDNSIQIGSFCKLRINDPAKSHVGDQSMPQVVSRPYNFHMKLTRIA